MSGLPETDVNVDDVLPLRGKGEKEIRFRVTSEDS